MAITVALGALAGGVTGAVLGFVSAVLIMTARRRRNARLVARGLPAPRDVVLLPLHLPCAIAGALAGGVAAVFGAPVSGVLLAASIPPVLLLLLGVTTAITTARGRGVRG